MFISSCAFFVGPILSMISAGKLHLAFFFGAIIFGLIGFYLLRIALWNTYGEEIFLFDECQISYEADYRWFKDAKRIIETGDIELISKPVGYIEDKKGVLTVVVNSQELESVVKMPLEQLEKMILQLKQQLTTGHN